MAPYGYLSQDLSRPLDRSGFATFLRSWSILIFTLGSVVGLWFVVSAIVSGWRREPLVDSMSRDALLHGPLVAVLLLMLLPNYDPRFPDQWSFQPKFVVGAFAVLLLLRLLHLLVDSWTPAGTRTALTQMKTGLQWETRRAQLRQLVSSNLHLPELFEIPFRQLLPYLLLVLIMFLGLGLRYQSLGYMSFDHDEMGLVAKSKGIFSLGFPYTMVGKARCAGRPPTKQFPTPLAFFWISVWLFGVVHAPAVLYHGNTLHWRNRAHGAAVI